MDQEKETVESEEYVDPLAEALEDVADEVAEEKSADESGDLDAQLQDAQKRVLRAQAELENFRKRSRREMEEERRYANLPLMRDILPVLDNFERAMAAEDGNDASAGLLDGLRMVAQQLKSVLEQYNCRAIQAQDETFDPMCHEALTQQPSNEYEKGRVSQVVQAGYRLHDRVIRPAQVIVSTGPEEA